jgi:hypothetical protein
MPFCNTGDSTSDDEQDYIRIHDGAGRAAAKTGGLGVRVVRKHEPNGRGPQPL